MSEPIGLITHGGHRLFFDAAQLVAVRLIPNGLVEVMLKGSGRDFVCKATDEQQEMLVAVLTRESYARARERR